MYSLFCLRLVNYRLVFGGQVPFVDIRNELRKKWHTKLFLQFWGIITRQDTYCLCQNVNNVWTSIVIRTAMLKHIRKSIARLLITYYQYCLQLQAMENRLNVSCLQGRIACIPGGRDKEGRPIILLTIPVDSTAIDAVPSLQYLLSIFR